MTTKGQKKNKVKAKVGKLKIKKETVKDLTDQDLKNVVGGMMVRPDSYSTNNPCPKC